MLEFCFLDIKLKTIDSLPFSFGIDENYNKTNLFIIYMRAIKKSFCQKQYLVSVNELNVMFTNISF